jgi:hypothetical protein
MSRGGTPAADSELAEGEAAASSAAADGARALAMERAGLAVERVLVDAAVAGTVGTPSGRRMRKRSPCVVPIARARARALGKKDNARMPSLVGSSGGSLPGCQGR